MSPGSRVSVFNTSKEEGRVVGRVVTSSVNRLMISDFRLVSVPNINSGGNDGNVVILERALSARSRFPCV
jgi:hypothetical protein